MVYQISSEEEYLQVMKKVEAYLQTATKREGFHLLVPGDRAELQHLSKIAEVWEDDIQLMPISCETRPL